MTAVRDRTSSVIVPYGPYTPLDQGVIPNPPSSNSLIAAPTLSLRFIPNSNVRVSCINVSKCRSEAEEAGQNMTLSNPAKLRVIIPSDRAVTGVNPITFCNTKTRTFNPSSTVVDTMYLPSFLLRKLPYTSTVSPGMNTSALLTTIAPMPNVDTSTKSVYSLGKRLVVMLKKPGIGVGAK